MNDETPFTAHGDEPVEARIVSWVLGEASAFEVAELERLCEERPELMVFKRRMAALHGLITEAEKPRFNHAWKLPAGKRRPLDEIIGEEKPVLVDIEKEKRIRHSGRRAFLAIAACLILTVVVAGLMAPMVLKQSRKADVSEARSKAMQRELAAMEDQETGVIAYQSMESLRTELPQERIEGTPKPIVLPGQTPSNEKAQRSAPAMMMGKRAQPESALKPSTPSSSMAKVISSNTVSATAIPTPDVDLATPSLDFGDGKDFGTGWGGADDGRLAERDARPRIVPDSAAADAPSPSATPPAPAEPGAEFSLALRDTDDFKGGKGSGSGGGFSNAPAEGKRSNDGSIVSGGVSVLADVVEGGLKNDLAALEENKKGTYGFWVGDESAKAEMRAKNLPANRGMIVDELEVTEEASSGRGPAPSAIPGQMSKKSSGSESYSELAQREMVRRQKNADEGDRDIAYYEDPFRTNPALTFEHQQKVDEVRKDLYRAEGNFNLGKYDDSRREYENVLRKDPYNTAARKGMEQIASAKSDYYRAAYDHTRAELLAQVDNAWELNVPAESGDKDKFDGTVNYGSPIQESSNFGTAEHDAPKLSNHLTGFTGESNEADADKVPLLGEIPLAGAIFKADSKPGVRESEIHAGYTSEYLFRGGDLGEKGKELESAVPADKVEIQKTVKAKKKAKPEPPKVDLTQFMEEIVASEDPYSTFSLNISDASFQIAQAALAKGERPDPAGIKVEQFYNAVNYGDPAPAVGQPVSCVIEQAAHPVIPGRNLVRVALKTAAAGRSAAQPLRLTLLVDQSGSMVRADRREAMDAAMRSLGTLLTDKDLVTVIGFSRTSRLLAVDMKGSEVGEKLAGLVNQAASEGGTNLEEAIKLAEQKAMRQKLVGAQNRIVLFTDGAANLGDADPQRLAAKVEQLRQQGIAFDIAGIAADDLNDELLAELARKGNGRYSVVGKGDNQNFAKQLAGSFRPAAENVKVQVRFNPERVARYKLIGFEKDRLKTEDFRNDAVDAAELAAEEAGVAIYQVEPLAEGRGEIGEVSVRFRNTASGEMVERMWTMAHDPATPGVGRATPSMQLAVLAMLAGEKLKGGPLADAIDFKQFAEPQAVVKQAFGQDTRVAEMLRMVDVLK